MVSMQERGKRAGWEMYESCCRWVSCTWGLGCGMGFWERLGWREGFGWILRLFGLFEVVSFDCFVRLWGTR